MKIKFSDLAKAAPKIPLHPPGRFLYCIVILAVIILAGRGTAFLFPEVEFLKVVLIPATLFLFILGRQTVDRPQKETKRVTTKKPKVRERIVKKDIKQKSIR